MARIVGLVGALAGSDVQRMVEVQKGHPAWPMTIRSVQGARLGATDPRAQALASSPTWTVVLDGWIYNRSDFPPANSDAGRVLAALEKKTFEEVIRLINGDFALAAYNADNRELWLARDRFGLRPLFYAHDDETLGFASRCLALFALPFVRISINRRWAAVFAGAHYRYIDNRPAESPFEDIRQLPAASLLHWKNNHLSLRRYWSLEDRGDLNASEKVLAEQYRDLLLDAVKLRLAVAHAPAFTLSGGMDSSSVLSCAAHLIRERQPAFSTTYRDITYDESEEIRPMLDHAVSIWHRVEIEKPDVFGCVREMVRCHDEPVATATWLSHYLLCKRVREEGFGSLFGGLGGDELNAGEYEYFFFYFADLRREGREEDLRREVELWARYHDHPIYRKNYDVMEDALRRLVDLKRSGLCKPDQRRMTRYYHAINRDFFDLSLFEPEMENPFSSYLKNRTYQDLTRETAPCCLRAEDRHTSLFGLENFLPFFDHRLVEFMYQVPGDMKIRDGITKRLLREAMRGILPEETRVRVKKTGWNAPAHLWFSVERKDELMDLVRSATFRRHGVFHAAIVESLINEHYEIVASGRSQEHHMMFLWQMLNMECWLSQVEEWSAKRKCSQHGVPKTDDQ